MLALANSGSTVKRLHDRGRSGAWAFLMIVRGCCWRVTGRFYRVSGNGRWAFYPDVDSGDDAYRSWCVCGTQGENKYGKDTEDVKYKAEINQVINL